MLLREFIGVRATSDLDGGRGGAVTFLPEKSYTVPECLSSVTGIQKHLYSMKRKTRL